MAIATTITTAKRRSGGNAAPFVVGALVVAVGLWFSWMLLPGRDGIAPLLPGSVVSYLHGNGDDIWLIGDARIAELRPYEFAVVGFWGYDGTDDEGFRKYDGSRVHGTVLRFSPLQRVPTELLSEVGAVAFAPRTYVIGEDVVITALTETNVSRFASGQGSTIGRTLSALRGAFDVQMLIPSDLYKFPFLVNPPSALMIGATVRDDGFFAAVSAHDAVPRNAFGYRAPTRQFEKTDALVPEGAVLTVIADDGSRTPATSIAMGSIDAVRTMLGAPRSSKLESAEDDLSMLLEGSSVSLVKFRDTEPQAVTVIPASVDRDALLDAIGRYVAASIPDRRPITLPDGSWTTELVFMTEPTLESAGPKTHRLTERFRTFAETDLLVTFEGDRTVIATSINGLNAGLGARTPSLGSCGDESAPVPSLILSDAAQFGGLYPRLDAITAHTGITKLLITEIGEESFKICGYN